MEITHNHASRQYDCKYLVTKDTGKAGGFQEKIDAALMCDVIPVIIGRPFGEEGLSVAEYKHNTNKTLWTHPETSRYTPGNWDGK